MGLWITTYKYKVRRQRMEFLKEADDEGVPNRRYDSSGHYQDR